MVLATFSLLQALLKELTKSQLEFSSPFPSKNFLTVLMRLSIMTMTDVMVRRFSLIFRKLK